MKQLTIRVLAVAVAQPIVMFFLLRVVELGFLSSVLFATLIALLVGLGVYVFQTSRRATLPR